MATPQPFGIIAAGLPPLLDPTTNPTPTSFTYTIPATPNRPFNHLVVFLLPGITLPPDTAAAVYLTFSAPDSASNFRFLGAIGPGKESAIFKVNPGNGATNSNGDTTGTAPNMSVPQPGTAVTIGISIEPASAVAAQMETLAASKNGPTSSSSSAMVPFGKTKQPDAVQLAQRIIKNAFNFLASFSGNVPVPGANGVQGMEVVPLKAFEEWWHKFEGRVRSDPGFLERDTD